MISQIGDDECLKSFAKNWPVTIRPHKIKRQVFTTFLPLPSNLQATMLLRDDVKYVTFKEFWLWRRFDDTYVMNLTLIYKNGYWSQSKIIHSMEGEDWWWVMMMQSKAQSPMLRGAPVHNEHRYVFGAICIFATHAYSGLYIILWISSLGIGGLCLFTTFWRSPFEHILRIVRTFCSQWN